MIKGQTNADNDQSSSTHMHAINYGSTGIANNSIAPSEEHNLNYYQEYCRLFIANVVLTTQMKELVTEKNDLLSKLAKLEKKKEDYEEGLGLNDQDDKKKRFRRTASEIDRHYKCPIESCQKSYGSEGSLNQHIKLKHPEYYVQMLQMNQEKDSQNNMSNKSFSTNNNVTYNVMENEKLILQRIVENYVDEKSNELYELEEIIQDIESSEIRSILLQKITLKDEI